MSQPVELTYLPAASVADLAAMAAVINDAHMVAIFGGGGCSEAQAATRSLAEKLKAPVGYALMGKRWLERDNPEAVGMTGLLGYGGCWGAVNHALQSGHRRCKGNYYSFMAEDPVAFPRLDESELAVLQVLGTRRSVAVGEYLYREGDASYDFYVVLSGAAEIVVGSGGEERVLARHGAGRFLGELNLLTGLRVFVSARVVEPGEVLVVPAVTLRSVLATKPGLGDRILAAFLARRSVLLSGAAAANRVIGSRFSPESLRPRGGSCAALPRESWPATWG